MNSVKIPIWPSGQVVVPQSVRYGGAILTEFQDRYKSKTTNTRYRYKYHHANEPRQYIRDKSRDGNPEISKYVRELTPIILSLSFIRRMAQHP